ncbi:MAG: PTS sugar transporter subunit IIA [Sebaldella sp.]|nr:PTS sugar transporter subunit IIA [Sebaldella sp.]
MMNEKLISLKMEMIKSPQEAIMESGKLLLKNGNIKDEYIDSMINSYKKNGAYIVIAPRIAMPHAREKDGVINAGFSILTLKEPIKFGNEENDPVDVIIGLASGNSEEHIEIIQKITKIFSNKEKLEVIFKTTDKKEVIKLFEEE